MRFSCFFHISFLINKTVVFIIIDIDIAMCISKVVVVYFNKNNYQMNVIGFSLGNSTLGPMFFSSLTNFQVSKSPRSIKMK